MPMRMIDGPALWRSKKLKTVPAEYRAEYANLLPLAEANGAFEFDPDAVWADVYAFNRPDVSPERCALILAAFVDADMITTYQEGEKSYGYFEGIDKPGRLPSPKHQERYANLPPVPTRPQADAAAQAQAYPASQAAPSGNRPIESSVEDRIRDVIGFAEERIHWKKEIRDAVKTHGYDVVLASLDIWLEGQRVFTGKRPVSAFLRSLPSLAAAGARPAAAQSPALQKVEDEIALLSNNLVVFSNAQKPHLALMVKDDGPEAVLHVFREFWAPLDDYGKKWAAKDFIEKGPQFLRTFRIQQVQRQQQQDRAADTRASLQSEGEAELAALEQADAQQASVAADAFAEFE